MSESTWDDYVEAGGTDSAELEDLAEDIGAGADVLDSVADSNVGTQAEAAGDAATELRDAQWDTSTAGEWTAEAERDVAYADTLGADAERHAQGAVDALEQGDTAAAEWESTMAESSHGLSEEAFDQADSGLGVADDYLSNASDDVDLAADTLADSGIDTSLDTSLDTSMDTSLDTGLDSGLDFGGDDSI